MTGRPADCAVVSELASSRAGLIESSPSDCHLGRLAARMTLSVFRWLHYLDVLKPVIPRNPTSVMNVFSVQLP
jgi:hypothetical protein